MSETTQFFDRANDQRYHETLIRQIDRKSANVRVDVEMIVRYAGDLYVSKDERAIASIEAAEVALTGALLAIRLTLHAHKSLQAAE